MKTPSRAPLLLSFVWAAAAASLSAQSRGPLEASDERALQSRMASATARLERLVELRIRLDLGLRPASAEIASHAGLPVGRAAGEGERVLAAEQDRLARLSQRLSELASGSPAREPGGGDPHEPPTQLPDVDSEADPEEPPVPDRVSDPSPESRTASQPAVVTSRPASRSSSFVQLDPGALGLGPILSLLETGKTEEAAAVLKSFHSDQAGMTEFVAGLSAERAGNLDAAERSFEAALEKLRMGNVTTMFAKSLEQSVQLALDHAKWKKERLLWKRPSIPESGK